MQQSIRRRGAVAGALKRRKTQASPKKEAKERAENSIGEHTYQHVTHIGLRVMRKCLFLYFYQVCDYA